MQKGQKSRQTSVDIAPGLLFSWRKLLIVFRNDSGVTDEHYRAVIGIYKVFAASQSAKRAGKARALLRNSQASRARLRFDDPAVALSPIAIFRRALYLR